ncbi:MAG: hypothetical protein NUV84_05490, partial [Candidatus Uhrbacteria bacterium]|nr:hypothetical protein [Candidatus Uhrbacteria bacterium]
MSVLREEPHKLRRNSRPPSTRVWYTMTLEIVGGMGFRFILKEEPYQNEIHDWSKTFDPDIDQRSQIVGLLHTALQDLDQALVPFRIRIAHVEACRDHVPLNHFSGELTRLVLTRFRGGLHFQPFSDGKIDDTLAKMER